MNQRYGGFVEIIFKSALSDVYFIVWDLHY